MEEVLNCREERLPLTLQMHPTWTDVRSAGCLHPFTEPRKED